MFFKLWIYGYLCSAIRVLGNSPVGDLVHVGHVPLDGLPGDELVADGAPDLLGLDVLSLASRQVSNIQVTTATRAIRTTNHVVLQGGLGLELLSTSFARVLQRKRLA